jgi:EAL domain-containing protein (putative c-di-GMP-specific phosphodiesterase class I)/ActR/RegA family two-component response regulator
MTTDKTSQAATKAGPGVGRRLLVVDDEPSLRELMTELLTEAGYRVTACANGRAALEALQRETHDAILTDIRMPDMDGLSLLRAVREKDLDLPVVLFTGGPSVETATEAVEWGALQYLAKPVPAERLLEVAGRAVRLGSLARLKREALASIGFEKFAGDRAGLESAFGRAVASIWMACQPIVSAADRRPRGHEVLLRTAETAFQSVGGLLSAAETLGRLPDLGRTVRAATAKLAASGVLRGDIFMNLHPLDLTDDALFDPKAPLSAFASRVVLEITERASLECVADVKQCVASLRRLGYRIAIDDLGAGYSGLTSFTALTPEVVKIDMALVRGLDTDVVKQKLVGSMAGLCHDLGMVVVAEGVETEAECAAVVRARCDLLQGFLFGRPS